MNFAKLLSAFSIVFFLSTPISAQFQVIRIVGHVLYGEDTLRTEDMVGYSSELTFINGDDKYSAVAVFNTIDRRRYVIKHQDESPGPKMGIVEENMHASRVERASRSPYSAPVLEYLELLFEPPAFGIFNGVLALYNVEPDSLINENDSLFVSYQFKGEEVRKRISIENSYPEFSAVELFQIDGVPFSPVEAKEFELKYYQAEDGSIRSIAKFQPIFPTNRELKKILDECLEQVSIFDDEFTMLMQCIDSHFGRVDYENATPLVEEYLSKR